AGAYHRFAEAAREARQRARAAVERAREQVGPGRERALTAAAPQYARGPWDAAELKVADAQAAFLAESLGRAVDLFNEAVALYGRAERDAAEARQAERRRAEEARERATQSRATAMVVDAPQHAPSLWSAAVEKSAEADAALTHEQYSKAIETLTEAHAL